MSYDSGSNYQYPKKDIKQQSSKKEDAETIEKLGATISDLKNLPHGFLDSHVRMCKDLGVDTNHVIIDLKDWYLVKHIVEEWKYLKAKKSNSKSNETEFY